MRFAFGCVFSALALAASLGWAQQTEWTQELHEIESAWWAASYETPESERDRLYEELSSRTDVLVAAHPNRAEPLIWSAIVKTSWAGARGGMQALRLANESRAALESAERIDARALGGSVYTSLGQLYLHVPGWPLGFGSDDKARAYFERALEVNPSGIDSNYFYGAFLADAGDAPRARQHLERALAAPPKPGRERAETHRRKEIEERLARLPAPEPQSPAAPAH